MQEQNLPSPVGPEGAPSPVESTPVGGEATTAMPESQPSPVEKRPAAGDAVNQSAPVMPVTDLPQPIAPTTPQVQSDSAPANTPAVADDVDVIEKVWVDKAKSIVKETKQDPYEQERKVSGLQSDYQKKRYGNEPNQQM